MKKRIPLSSISLSALEKQYVMTAIDGSMLSSTGPYVAEFERAFAQQIGVGHAVAAATGSAALELIFRALDIGTGDEVIVPAFTFASPALAVALVGAKPVFADIDPETWTIDPVRVRELKTSRTRAVIAVDVVGHPCDYDSLEKIGLPIIEDAAETHGATYRGRSVGSFGVGAIFSFQANKAVSSGEGGCVVTNDLKLANRVRKINMFGMDPERRYWHTELGSNYRMTNLVAAVALAQVERWSELLEGRARVATLYDNAIGDLPITRRPVASWAGEAVWLYTLASERRDDILSACVRSGIDARAVWPSLPENLVFQKYNPSACPIARRISGEAFWLPTWSDMPAGYVEDISTAIRSVFPDQHQSTEPANVPGSGVIV
jgi:perosamine synthetase